MIGGTARLIEENEVIKAIEIKFVGQPIEYAPQTETDVAKSALSIAIDSPHLPSIEQQLSNLLSFLQCYFHVRIKAGEVSATFDAETLEEQDMIPIPAITYSRLNEKTYIPFDMFFRASLAAEKEDGPVFEATLQDAARSAFFDKKYIDSYRYSFLYLEAVCGNGKFKKEQLVSEFLSNPSLTAAITHELSEYQIIPSKNDETATLLQSKPSLKKIIEHLVEKRGFYFHGNKKHKQGWKPHEQAAAATLSEFALFIVQQLAGEAATLMFQPELSERYMATAKALGMIVKLTVQITYRRLDEVHNRTIEFNINTPGTKVTNEMAKQTLRESLQRFDHHEPQSKLIKVACIEQATNKQLFTVNFDVV